MRLKKLLEHVRFQRLSGPADRPVAGVSCDSRTVTLGGLFVAVRGSQSDGHDYIPEAIGRGAGVIVAERAAKIGTRVTYLVVPDSRRALARIGAAFYGLPSRKLTTVGITGTNGKTSVAFMLKHFLQAGGVSCGLTGTVRYEVGDRSFPARRTTPDGVEIQRLMRQMVDAGCGACVMEVSSHALDQCRVQEVAFSVAVFTNLTRDHLDYHGSLEAYFAAKMRLFEALSSQGARPTPVVNMDDDYGRRLAGMLDDDTLFTYGASHPRAKVRSRHIVLDAKGSRFTAETPMGIVKVFLPMIGRHNVDNALAAMSAALVLGVDPKTMAASCASMPAVPGRLERIDLGQPFDLLVDYAHTQDALDRALTALRALTTGRLLVAFGCGGTRDIGKRPQMGRIAARLADRTWITTDNPRKEAPEAIASQILAGYREIRNDGWCVELDRRRAIERAIAEAREGDVVLLAGKGHEAYQEFEDAVVPFDDRIHASEILEQMGLGAAKPVSF